MDLLSPLMQLARPQARLDLRCTLAGPAQLPHDSAPAGQLPFHLVLSGRCRVSGPGLPERLLQAGDCLLLPHGHAHSLAPQDTQAPLTPLHWRTDGWLPQRHDGGQPDAPPGSCGSPPAALDLLCGHFQHEAGPMQLLLQGLPPVWVVTLPALMPGHGPEPASGLALLGAWLRHEVLADQPGSRALVTSLCQALLTLALRHSSQHTETPPGTLALLAHARLRPAVQAMLDQPAAPWTLQALAQHSALSRASFARHFTQVAGRPAMAWLTAWRLQLAGMALQDSQRSVADIAHSVGYSGPAALERPFRQQMGCSPAQWRRAGLKQAGLRAPMA